MDAIVKKPMFKSDPCLADALFAMWPRKLTVEFLDTLEAYLDREDGEWEVCDVGSLPHYTEVHAIRTKDGRIWDRVNGWRVQRPDVSMAPKQSSDMVMHPPHYARWKMEPIEFIAINDLPWWLANVIKYTMRFDAKDGLRDLYKARSYLDMKIRETEGHARFWDKPVGEERKLNAQG